MITFHGANYLMLRTEGDIYRRARFASTLFGLLTVASFLGAGLWVESGLPGYILTAGADPGALPNPLAKTVAIVPGAWMSNYARWSWAMYVPALGIVGALLGVLLARLNRPGMAFIASALSMAGIIGTAGVSMFPFVMPSSSDPRSSLTVWDSVSSHLTLSLMFWATVIFMPLIVFYTAWAYKVMAGKVTLGFIRANDKSAY